MLACSGTNFMVIYATLLSNRATTGMAICPRQSYSKRHLAHPELNALFPGMGENERGRTATRDQVVRRRPEHNATPGAKPRAPNRPTPAADAVSFPRLLLFRPSPRVAGSSRPSPTSVAGLKSAACPGAPTSPAGRSNARCSSSKDRGCTG